MVNVSSDRGFRVEDGLGGRAFTRIGGWVIARDDKGCVIVPPSKFPSPLSKLLTILFLPTFARFKRGVDGDTNLSPIDDSEFTEDEVESCPRLGEKRGNEVRPWMADEEE